MRKHITILLTAASLWSTVSFAHERITIGPKGGRVIYLDSTTIPNIEFKVNEEGYAEITLLDKERKPITLDQQSIAVTAGPRSSAKKLKVEKVGDTFVSEKTPAGAPYVVVIQVKANSDAKPLTARLNYDPKPSAAGKPTYLDDSVNEGSGPSVTIPESLDGLWAEINGHHGELKDNFAKKAYEPLDEVTQAFTVLLKSLPAKSGDKKDAVSQQVDTLVAAIAMIADANAARELPKAAKTLESVNTGIAALKQHLPAKTANSKL